MMGALREWLTSLVTVALLLSAAQTLIPEGSLRKIMSFTGGLILLTVLLRPVLGADLSRLHLEADTYADAVATRQEELEAAGREALEEGIAQQTAAYISDKAVQLGLDVTVRVETEPGEDGTPVPAEVAIDGAWSAELSAWMAQEVGIPAERQVWNGTETGN